MPLLRDKHGKFECSFCELASQFGAVGQPSSCRLLVVEHGERTGVSVCCSTLAQLGATVVALWHAQGRL